jgi:hypothetical protein
MDVSSIARSAAPWISGGLGGSVLTLFVSWIRNRVQPVSYRVSSASMLSDSARSAGLPITLTFEEGGDQFVFKNLALAELVVTNSGNRDFKEFPLGITIRSAEVAVQFIAHTPDRYHHVEEVKTVSPRHIGQEIDIILKPFNRKDRYLFGLWLHPISDGTSPPELRLSTDEAVRFVQSPTRSEILGTVLQLVGATAGVRVERH